MKHFLILLFFSTLVFANYTYKGENSGKIDMHGGKKQKLIEDKQNLSNKNFMLGNIGLGTAKDKKEQNNKEKQKDKN